MKLYLLTAVLILLSADLSAQSTDETAAILIPAAAHVRASLPPGQIVIETSRSTKSQHTGAVAASLGAHHSALNEVVKCQSRRNCKLEGYSGILSIIGPVRTNGVNAEVVLRAGRQATANGRNWIAFQDVVVKLRREGKTWNVTGSRVVRES